MLMVKVLTQPFPQGIFGQPPQTLAAGVVTRGAPVVGEGGNAAHAAPPSVLVQPEPAVLLQQPTAVTQRQAQRFAPQAPVNTTHHTVVKKSDALSVLDFLASSFFKNKVSITEKTLDEIAGEFGRMAETQRIDSGQILWALIEFAKEQAPFRETMGLEKAFDVYGLVLGILERLTTFNINYKDALGEIANRTGHPIPRAHFVYLMARDAGKPNPDMPNYAIIKWRGVVMQEVKALKETIAEWPTKWRLGIDAFLRGAVDLMARSEFQITITTSARLPGVQIYRYGTDAGGFCDVGDEGLVFASSINEGEGRNTQQLKIRALYGDAKLIVRRDTQNWYIKYVNKPEKTEGFIITVDGAASQQIGDQEEITIPLESPVIISSEGHVFELGLYSTHQKKDIIETAKEFQKMTTDPGTGLPNSRAWDAEIAALEARGDSYTIVAFDVDGLKAANDHQPPRGCISGGGHKRGDHFLAEVARMLRSRVRAEEVTIFRMHAGGDELYALIRNKTAEQCHHLVARMLYSVEGPDARIVYEHRDMQGQFLWNQTILPTITAGIADATMAHGASNVKWLANEQMEGAKRKARRGGAWYLGQEIVPNLRYPMPQSFFEDDRPLIERLLHIQNQVNAQLVLATDEKERAELLKFKSAIETAHAQLIRDAKAEKSGDIIAEAEKEQLHKKYPPVFDKVSDQEIKDMSFGEKQALLRLLHQRILTLYDMFAAKGGLAVAGRQRTSVLSEIARARSVLQILAVNYETAGGRDQEIYQETRDYLKLFKGGTVNRKQRQAAG
ncbi:MAG: GGDEF domain-containing protein [Deltaproteobacteria bacterium]|nr:GGDEF domain-containing protein [Deltaproteobacteria bacterium]